MTATTLAPVPAGVPDALAMIRARLAYLASADPTALTAGELARCLQELEKDDAIATAVRTWQLGGRLAGPSPPLDAGVSETVPAAIRHALLVRSGGHCESPRCRQPASACHVHHLIRRAGGGKTSVNSHGPPPSPW